MFSSYELLVEGVPIALPAIGSFIKGGLCTTIGRLQGVRRRITYVRGRLSREVSAPL